jgi:hypothetical protein
MDEMVPTSSMVLSSRVEASSNRLAQGGTSNVEASRMVYEAATSMYQASLFSATMMAHSDFSPATVFKMAATMCKLGNSTVAKALGGGGGRESRGHDARATFGSHTCQDHARETRD